MLNKDLIKEALKIKYYIILVIIIGAGTGLVAVFQANTLSRIVDSVFIKGFSLDKVWGLMFLLLLYILLRGLLIWISEVVSRAGVVRIKHNLRQRIQHSIFTTGPIPLRNENTGEVLNMTIEGIEALDAYFSEYLPQLAISVLTPLLILFFVFPIDLLCGIIMLVTAPLIPLFMILIGKWAKELTEKQWESLSRLGGHFLQMLYGLPTLKLFGRSKSQSRVIYKFSENLRKDTMGVLKVAFLSALTLELLATLSTAFIAVTLGLKLIYGKMSFLDGFFLLLLVPEYYQPLRQLGAKFHAGMSGNAAAKDIFHFLKKHDNRETEDITNQSRCIEGTRINEVSFADVSFNYKDNNSPILKNVSFTIGEGEFTALVGYSGSGKSTILSLILGFIKLEDGRVTINGIDVKELSLKELRKNIGYISQNPYLFHGTILENLVIAKPDAKLEEIIKAAKLSGADEFINKLKSGYRTNLGEGGLGLSGGQKQLLAITRVFLKNTSLIIMDEPTASLDSENEKKVSEALERLSQGRTVLVATHNLSVIKKADRILIIEDGSMVESGCREELLEKYNTLIE